MALTRKFLSAMGIEPDKIDEIITAHADTVDGLKEDRDAAKAEAAQFKADAEKFPIIQKELEDLKQAGGHSPYEDKYNQLKEDYDKLKGEFEAFKSDADAKAVKAAKEKAYRDFLKELGVSEKRLDSVIKVSNLDEIEVDKDGKIKDADKLKESAKKEWSDFIVQEQQFGASTPKPGVDNLGAPRGESRAAKMVAQYRNEHYGNPIKED